MTAGDARTDPSGPAERSLDWLTTRFFLACRASSVPACGLAGALGVGRPATPWWVASAILVLTVWVAVLLIRAPRHGLSVGWCWLDLVLIAALGIAQPQLVAADALSNGSWVLPLMSTAVALAQFVLPAWGGAVGVLLIVPAYLTGHLLAGGDRTGALVAAVILTVQAGLARILAALVRGGSRAADQAIADEAAVAGHAAGEAARRAGEREADRHLHDTVAATLLMVGTATLPDSPEQRSRVSAAAAADLRLLAGAQRPVPESADLRALLAERVLDRHAQQPGGPTVEVRGPSLDLPYPVAEALVGATGEALTNVARHADATTAAVTVDTAPGGAVVTITDDGQGFEPGSARSAARGIRESLAGRMAGVGGSAVIDSVPQRGTQVVLRWPANSPRPEHGTPDGGNGSIRPAALAAARYAARLDVAAVLIGLIWVGGYDLVSVLLTAPRYANPLLPVVAWGVLLGLTCVGSAWLLMADGPAKWATAFAVAAVAAGAVVTIASPPELLIDNGAWAWGGVGWVAVVLLLRSRLVVMIAVLAGHHAVIAIVLAGHGMLDRASVSRFLAVLYGTSVFQVAVVAAAAALGLAARRAGESAAAQAAATTARRAAAESHRARRQRYAALQDRVVPLLIDLADGRAVPADPEVAHRCAAEAARLRRLFAESDDEPEPLLHELRATVDVADRRAVMIDLAVAGVLPPVPLSARRALLEAPAVVVAAATGWARVAVLAESGAVRVSVRAPLPSDRLFALVAERIGAGCGGGAGGVEDGAPRRSPVSIDWQRDGETIWAEAVWRPEAISDHDDDARDGEGDSGASAEGRPGDGLGGR